MNHHKPQRDPVERSWSGAAQATANSSPSDAHRGMSSRGNDAAAGSDPYPGKTGKCPAHGKPARQGESPNKFALNKFASRPGASECSSTRSPCSPISLKEVEWIHRGRGEDWPRRGFFIPRFALLGLSSRISEIGGDSSFRFTSLAEERIGRGRGEEWSGEHFPRR